MYSITNHPFKQNEPTPFIIYKKNLKKPLRINIKLTATNNLTQPPKMTSEMVESTLANIGFFLYQLDPEVRRLMRRLECAVFNQTCLNNDLLPQYTIYIYIYIHNIIIYVFIYIYIYIYTHTH